MLEGGVLDVESRDLIFDPKLTTDLMHDPKQVIYPP